MPVFAVSEIVDPLERMPIVRHASIIHGFDSRPRLPVLLAEALTYLFGSF